ncbi:Response regulator with CheY-like receiver domain and winged-helix DNA-binding domain [uncultured Eubacteriales bacterium]|uniref:Stage 0 sporulation protein A homolog n=1 Tax=uncultured Eubacteriales bacterium TaxID=172733 RepID=A0A212J7R1_9FIRM|nr:Response regulator with CheY-like receiver domain and winged-helix DNA-binding domain [uncultured Eubacteriales bacterium]
MKRAKILMVEDEANVLSMNREYLEHEGYEVASASSVAQARFLLEEHAPDLILLDVMLPDGLGWDFCAELRKKTNAPIIYLTSRDENESVVKGLLQGGDDYVTKPYDMSVLGARVAAQLRRAGLTAQRLLEFPPLAIDTLTGEVTLSGRPVSLTKKELQLLTCFVRFPGQRLSCEEIYRRAWGEGSADASRTITVHITNLRKKLGMDGGGWFEIRSSGKEGYIFSKVRY